MDQFKWHLKDTFGVDSFDPDYSKMLLWEDQPDTACGATLSREVIKHVRRRETAYRMIEALRDNRKIVGGSASMRDNMAAGSSVVRRGGKVVDDRRAMRDNTTVRM